MKYLALLLSLLLPVQAFAQAAGTTTVPGQMLNSPLVLSQKVLNTGPPATLTGNGQGTVGTSSTLGAIIQGQGSTNDFTFENNAGTTVCNTATGTTVFKCATLQLGNVTGTTQCAQAASTGVVSGTGIPCGAPTFTPTNLGLAISASGGALTVAIVGQNGSAPSATNPVTIPFNSGGTITNITLTSATSFTISACTAGSQSSVPFNLWIVGINNSGTIVPAVFISQGTTSSSNAAGVTAFSPLDESYSASASTCGSTTGSFYASGSASGAFRVLGFAYFASGISGGSSWVSPTSVVLASPGTHLPGEPLQSTNATSTTLYSTTSATPQNTFSASITPKFASSSILIEVSGPFGIQSLSDTSNYGLLRVLNTTNSVVDGYPCVVNAAATTGGVATNVGSCFLSVTDNPGSVSAQTYEVQIASDGSGTTVLNGTSIASKGTTIKLTEIMR